MDFVSNTCFAFGSSTMILSMWSVSQMQTKYRSLAKKTALIGAIGFLLSFLFDLGGSSLTSDAFNLDTLNIKILGHFLCGLGLSMVYMSMKLQNALYSESRLSYFVLRYAGSTSLLLGLAIGISKFADILI